MVSDLPEDDAIDPSLINDDLPTDAEALSIATLAQAQKAAEGEVIAATEALQAALNRYRLISEVQLPAAMRAASTSELTTDGGRKVKLAVAYDGKQLEDPEGLRWVEAHGGQPLIKTSVLVEMDAGDLEAAREIHGLLRQSRHANKFKTLLLKQNVHPQTLVAFVRRLPAGTDAPLEKLGVHRRTYAVVDRAPKRTDNLKGFERR
jgi:hypothetical protein